MTRSHEELVRRLRIRLEDLGLDVSAFDDQKCDLWSSTPLPDLKYGFTESPLTWEQLEKIILVEQDLAKLSRSEEQQQEYEIFRYLLQQQYSSLLDYILISKFGFEKKKQKHNDSSRFQSCPSLQDYGVTRSVLVPNDFPYFMAEGIVHYVLWKTNDAVTTHDIDAAKRELTSKIEGVVDTLHWINPPHLQSLPDIDHAHILCRLKLVTTRNDN